MDAYNLVEIKFMVGNEEYSNKQLMVTIPFRYKELFSGAKFENMHHLSIALMYAKCADEARVHNKPHLVRQHENALKKALNQ